MLPDYVEAVSRLRADYTDLHAHADRQVVGTHGRSAITDTFLIGHIDAPYQAPTPPDPGGLGLEPTRYRAASLSASFVVGASSRERQA